MPFVNPNWHSVDLATTTPLPLVVSNSRTLTNTSVPFVTLVVDGIIATVGDIILVKNQVDTSQNGPYIVTQIYNGGSQPFILQRTYIENYNVQMVFVIRTGDTLACNIWKHDESVTGLITLGVTLLVYIKLINVNADDILPTTTKGDLIVHNGTTNVRFPVGTDGQFIVANSAAGNGINWASPGMLGLTLQDAYDASVNPEIVLTAVPGALTIRDNATPIGANLLEVQNNAGGTTFFSVDTAGTTVNGKLTVTGLIDPTGLTMVEQASNPGTVAPGNGTIWVRNDVPNVPVFTNDAGTNFDLIPTTNTANEGCQVNRNGLQTITTSVVATVQYNFESSDPQNNFDSVTNFVYTAPVTGFYSATATVNWDSNTTSDRLLLLTKNIGTTNDGVARSDLPNNLLSGTATNPQVIVCDFFPMTSGETLGVQVFQQSGSNRNIGNQGILANQFCVAFLGS